MYGDELSSLTDCDAATTLQALAQGASDYVAKPNQVRDLEAAAQLVREQLLPRIKALCSSETPQPPPSRQRRGSLPPVGPVSAGRVSTPVPVGVLAVGASTGGPNALTALFSKVPRTLPVPVVIVQHMPPPFTKLLADRLSANCALTFHEAREGDRLEPGHAWIAPGDHHMRVVRDRTGVRIALDQGPPENSFRPAVDVLFRSIAATFGAATLAVVLTGMGQDGLRGCEHVYEQAGQIVVQDQATSVVWGMPGFVAKAGLAQAVLPLGELGGDILRRISRLRASGAGSRAV